MCQQQERSSVSAYFLIDREVQNKPQASSLHLIQIKRGRPLLGERCWEARHRITGLNDKRKFYKIVPLSYCGLVMPLFFFFQCAILRFLDLSSCDQKRRQWGPYQTVKMIGLNVVIKTTRMNSLLSSTEASACPIRRVQLSVFSKGTRTPNGQALTKHQKEMMTSKI